MADFLKGYSLYKGIRFPSSEERCLGVRMGPSGYNHIANNLTLRSVPPLILHVCHLFCFYFVRIYTFNTQ